jgi:hypothetical protein
MSASPTTASGNNIIMQAGNATAGGVGGSLYFRIGTGAGGPGNGAIYIGNQGAGSVWPAIDVSGPTTIYNSGPNTGTSLTINGGGALAMRWDWDNPNTTISAITAGNRVLRFTGASQYQVRGSGTTSSTTAFQVQNANASASLSVRDDGLVTVGASIGLPVSSYVYWGDINSAIQHTGAATNFRTYQDNQPWSFITANNSTVQASINSGQVRARTLFSSTGNSPVTMSGWDGGGGTAGNALLVKGGNSGVGAVYTGGNAGDLILENGLATDNSSGNGGTPGSIVFKYGTYNNTASVEYGRLNSSGNFLIGTTAGSAKLLISGSSNSALLEIDSPSVNNILYVSGSGNVGIGTGTPARTLEVNGTIGTSADGLGRGITMGTAVPGGSSYLNVGQGTGWIFNLTTNNATYTANSTRMSITDNGVGFGNFVANGGTVSATAQVRGSGTTTSTTTFLLQNSNATQLGYVDDSGQWMIGSGTNGGYKLDVNGTALIRNRLFLTGGDFVISGTDAVQKGIYRLPGNGNGLIFSENMQAGQIPFQFSSPFATPGTKPFNDASGRSILNINIGLGNPNTDNLSASVLLLDGAHNVTSFSGTTIRGIYYNPTITSLTGVVAHRAIETTTGSVVFNGGNVGIGTSFPSSSLHISGASAVLTLTPQSPLPSGVPTGSFAVSSSAPPKPYFYDGTTWNALY